MCLPTLLMVVSDKIKSPCSGVKWGFLCSIHFPGGSSDCRYGGEGTWTSAPPVLGHPLCSDQEVVTALKNLEHLVLVQHWTLCGNWFITQTRKCFWCGIVGKTDRLWALKSGSQSASLLTAASQVALGHSFYICASVSPW